VNIQYLKKKIEKRVGREISICPDRSSETAEFLATGLRGVVMTREAIEDAPDEDFLALEIAAKMLQLGKSEASTDK
jgi:hypothetical protein